MLLAQPCLSRSQVRHALGIDLPRLEHIQEFFAGLVEQLQATNLQALLVAVVAFAIGYLVKRFRPLWPNLLIALAMATLVNLPLQPGLATAGAIEGVVTNRPLQKRTLEDV